MPLRPKKIFLGFRDGGKTNLYGSLGLSDLVSVTEPLWMQQLHPSLSPLLHSPPPLEWVHNLLGKQNHRQAHKKKKIIILTWTQNQQRITRTEVKGEDRGKRCLSGNLMDLWLTAPSHVLASRKASGCKNRITSKVMEVKVSLKQEKWEFGIKNKITHKKFIPCTSEFNN